MSDLCGLSSSKFWVSKRSLESFSFTVLACSSNRTREVGEGQKGREVPLQDRKWLLPPFLLTCCHPGVVFHTLAQAESKKETLGFEGSGPLGSHFPQEDFAPVSETGQGQLETQMAQGLVDNTKWGTEEPSRWLTVLVQNMFENRPEDGKRRERAHHWFMIIWERGTKNSVT